MMAQYSFDLRVIAPVQAAIANWENEGGAVLPITSDSDRERSKRARQPGQTYERDRKHR